MNCSPAICGTSLHTNRLQLSAEQYGLVCRRRGSACLPRRALVITAAGKGAAGAGPSGRSDQPADVPLIQPSMVIPPPSSGSQYGRNQILENAFSDRGPGGGGSAGSSGRGGKGGGGDGGWNGRGGGRGGGADNVFSGGGFFGDKRYGLLSRVLVAVRFLAWSTVLYLLVDAVVNTGTRAAKRVWSGREAKRRAQEALDQEEVVVVEEVVVMEEEPAAGPAAGAAAAVSAATAGAPGPVAAQVATGTPGTAGAAGRPSGAAAAPATSSPPSSRANAVAAVTGPASTAGAPAAEGAAGASSADLPTADSGAGGATASASATPSTDGASSTTAGRAPFARYPEGARPVEYPTLAVFIMLLGSVGFFATLG